MSTSISLNYATSTYIKCHLVSKTFFLVLPAITCNSKSLSAFVKPANILLSHENYESLKLHLTTEAVQIDRSLISIRFNNVYSAISIFQ